MNTYAAKRITVKPGMTQKEYFTAMGQANIRYCHGIKELREFCGGKLRTNGKTIYGKTRYAGRNGDIHYAAWKL